LGSIRFFTVVFPFSPLPGLYEFRPLPVPFFIALGAIVIFCIVAAEIAKRVLYKKNKFYSTHPRFVVLPKQISKPLFDLTGGLTLA
jgi:hypothetical protein